MRNQAGDTLIEVALALAILSTVLVGSTVLVNQAFAAGQTANEQSVAINLLQQQAEGLRNLRDNTIGTWCTSFYDPIKSITLPVPHAFHLVPTGTSWTLAAGPDTSQVPYQVSITQTPVVLHNANPPPVAYNTAKIEFDITATWPARGGGSNNSTTISTYLVDLDQTTGGSIPGTCP